MKIIILGAGQVGGFLASHLAQENNDITLVDSNARILREFDTKLDIRTIEGHASHPSVLRDAGCADCDLLIAVTSSDEVNMVACKIADTIFNTPKKIARVRSSAYLAKSKIFSNEKGFAIDVQICPEEIVTRQIMRLIEYPGTLQVLEFAKGQVKLVGVKAYYGGPLVGQEICALREHMPDVDARISAIYRKNKLIIPTGDTKIEADDEVFFIANSQDVRAVMAEMRNIKSKVNRVVIAGGGNIGERLAAKLENSVKQVKILEINAQRCEYLAEKLKTTVVLKGSATDKSLINDENLESYDAFIAVTDDDEVNIMSSLLARSLGISRVFTLISNPAYVDLLQGRDIDVAFSPQIATVGSLLTHIRQGKIEVVHSLRRGGAEAIEVVALGDKESSRVVGRELEKIALPAGVTIGAIVRDKQVLIAHHDLVVEEMDHLIIFVADRRMMSEVEALFSVGVTYD